METAVAGMFARASGHFFAVNQDIVSSRTLCGNSQRSRGIDNYREIRLLVVRFAAGEEGKIRISKIMENRASSALPPGKKNAIGFHLLNIALDPGILMPSDYYRIGIAPEKQDVCFRIEFPKNPVFGCKVEPRVRIM